MNLRSAYAFTSQKHMRPLFSVFLFFSLLGLLPAQSDWSLAKEADGIRVYTRSVPGSGLKAFRGEVTLTGASLKAVLNTILDVEQFPKLSPRTASARLVKAVSDREHYIYAVTDAPWPVRDRDGIYHFRAEDTADGAVIVRMEARPDFLPHESGLVRIPRSEGFWQLQRRPDGRLRILYQNHTDPGGSIPAWLANSSVVNIPFKTLQNLKAQVGG